MRLPLWLIVLLFVLWAAWMGHRYYCIKCGCCGDATTTETSTSTGVPLFKWNAEKPESDANFGVWKKDLIKKGGQGDTLLITGLYRAAEANGEKLGLARAAAIAAMMKPDVPESRIRTAAKLTTDALADGGPAMESGAFSWLKMMLKKDEGAIIETANTTTILFPFNSTVRDKDPKVDTYLKALGEKHRSDNVTFSIVGHADNVGSDEENYNLGLGRAQAIAKTLQGHGILNTRIKTESKGKNEPVADNSTEDGRHQNRRVVITVNQ